MSPADFNHMATVHEQEQSIVAMVLGEEDPTRRESLLEAACAGDKVLRGLVEDHLSRQVPVDKEALWR